VFCATPIPLVAGRHECMQNENRGRRATRVCREKVCAGKVIGRKSSLNRTAPCNRPASAFQAFAQFVILRRGIILVSRDSLAFRHIPRHLRTARPIQPVPCELKSQKSIDSLCFDAMKSVPPGLAIAITVLVSSGAAQLTPCSDFPSYSFTWCMR